MHYNCTSLNRSNNLGSSWSPNQFSHKPHFRTSDVLQDRPWPLCFSLWTETAIVKLFLYQRGESKKTKKKKKKRRESKEKFSLPLDSWKFTSYMHQKFHFLFVSDFLYLCCNISQNHLGYLQSTDIYPMYHDHKIIDWNRHILHKAIQLWFKSSVFLGR